MVEINASTKITVKKPAAAATAGKKKATGVGAGIGVKKPAAPLQRRGSVAPPLKPALLATKDAIDRVLTSKTPQQQKTWITQTLFHRVLGEHTELQLNKPHAASTTRDRGCAAADMAVAVRELGPRFVMKECGIMQQLQLILMPNGIESILLSNDENDNKNGNAQSAMKPSTSALSLSSMASDAALSDSGDGGGVPSGLGSITSMTIGTDSKRGKTTPANAREGCLLLLRAICEIVLPSPRAEPYVSGAFLLAALDECASNHSHVRNAAEDAAAAIVSTSHPWSYPKLVVPLLLLQLRNRNNEWRVKACALEKIQLCATRAPAVVQKLIPALVPELTPQVWDTKAQVSKAAKSALLAVCQTNTNADIQVTIPILVQAICKPSETNKAVSELMGTTFVVPVDASTLAILCPVLSRALKEKLALHKRAACIVISNMSKLVETPQAIAPFGSLLVPELKRTAKNVQFEEIRDEALKALASLTKALGDLYNSSTAENDETDPAAAVAADAASKSAAALEAETKRVEEEQKRIAQEREEEARKEAELKAKEEEERRKFKEAMDAQRELDKLKFEEEQRLKKEEDLKKEKAKLSTKGTTGKCQGCGLKKCKKSCMFYGT